MSFMTPHLHYWMPQQHIFPAYPTGPTLYPSTHHQTDRPQHNVFRTRGTRNSPHWHHSTSRQPHAIRKEQAPTQPSTTRSETSRDWRKRDPPTQPAPHYMTGEDVTKTHVMDRMGAQRSQETSVLNSDCNKNNKKQGSPNKISPVKALKRLHQLENNMPMTNMEDMGMAGMQEKLEE